MVLRRNPSWTNKCTPCEVARECDPCCCCLPAALLVVLTDIVSEEDCPCEVGSSELPWDEFSETYHGYVQCRDLTIDVTISIEQLNGECHLCVESYFLGWTGDDRECVPFGDYANTPPSCDNLSAEWVTPYANLRVQPPDHTLMPNCELCEGCDCFCKSLHVEYMESDLIHHCMRCVDSMKLDWNEETQNWIGTLNCRETRIDLEFYFVRDELSNDCRLALESNALESYGTPISPSIISCPHIAAEWSIPRSVSPPDFGIVRVSCHEPEEEVHAAPSEICPDCCTDLDFHCEPDITLVATIDAPDCPDINGRSIVLSRGGGTITSCQGFSGSASVGPCGGEHSVPVSIEFFCTSNEECPSAYPCKNYQLFFSGTASDCCPPDPPGPYLPEDGCSCNPVYFSFVVPGITQCYPPGCDCCPSGSSMRIIITR